MNDFHNRIRFAGTVESLYVSCRLVWSVTSPYGPMWRWESANRSVQSAQAAAVRTLTGGHDVAVWGPFDDPVRSFCIFSIWPRFPEGAFVENEGFSSLNAEQCPQWWLRIDISKPRGPEHDTPLSNALAALWQALSLTPEQQKLPFVDQFYIGSQAFRGDIL